MSTMTQIVDQAIAEVYSATQVQDVSSFLTSGMTATALTGTVSNGANFSRGLVQIGDEMMFIDSVDRGTGVMTLGNLSGRGVQGTTAATHSTGDRVIMSPTVPRAAAVRAVEETIRAVGSAGLFGTATTTTPFVSVVSGYAIPATAIDMLDVAWFPPGPENSWSTIRRWTFDRYSSQIVISEGLVAGQDMRFTYSVDPVVPTSGQAFSVTGLPASCEDVVRYGAVYRLISALEPMSLATQTAEADAMSSRTTPGLTRVRVAQFYYQLYQQRLNEEVRNLQTLFPPRVHFTGRR